MSALNRELAGWKSRARVLGSSSFSPRRGRPTIRVRARSTGLTRHISVVRWRTTPSDKISRALNRIGRLKEPRLAHQKKGASTRIWEAMLAPIPGVAPNLQAPVPQSLCARLRTHITPYRTRGACSPRSRPFADES